MYDAAADFFHSSFFLRAVYFFFIQGHMKLAFCFNKTLGRLHPQMQVLFFSCLSTINKGF